MSGIEIYGTAALDSRPKKKTREHRLIHLVHDREMEFARRLLVIVAETMNRPLGEIFGQGRSSRIYPARMVAIMALREFTMLSKTAIGELIGGRDHSTIIYGLERAARATWMPGKMTEIRQRMMMAEIRQRGGEPSQEPTIFPPLRVRACDDGTRLGS